LGQQQSSTCSATTPSAATGTWLDLRVGSKVYVRPVSHRIAEASRLSGFPPASLRYYEQIGLLPPAARSDGGYRLYSDRDIDRLRFIGRAKQLGCTLEEITGLAAAWDGDECASVQHHLTDLVGRKIAATRSRITELLRFAAELESAATSLAAVPNEGPCDEGCRCMRPVDVAVACTLGADEMGSRIAEWQDVLAHVRERTPIEGGLRLVLGGDVPMEEVLRLAAAEHGCCAFFSFALTIDERGTALEVTAPADAAAMVEAVFGAGQLPPGRTSPTS
jgi:MerR family copper efflux transcriptional regulator